MGRRNMFTEPIEESERNRFLMYVAEDIAKLAQLSPVEAERIVYASPIIQLIDQAPRYVCHHGTYYWAKRLIHEGFVPIPE
jgi:hypothetical protein